MSYSSAPYEHIAESGDSMSAFDFSEKSIRHGNTQRFIF